MTYIASEEPGAAARQQEGPPFTPAVDLLPYDYPLAAELWTQHNRLIRDDMQHEEDWRSKRLVLSAAQHVLVQKAGTPWKAPAWLVRVGVASLVLLLVAVLLVSAYSLGLAAAMR